MVVEMKDIISREARIPKLMVRRMQLQAIAAVGASDGNLLADL